MLKRRCFISAAYASDLTMLQSVLDGAGVLWEWPPSAQTKSTIIETTREAIKKSDFVLSVIQDATSLPNLAFDLGVAVGVGKPILLLSAGAIELPSSLLRLDAIRTDLADTNLLREQLDIFLRTLESRRTPKKQITVSASSRPSLQQAFRAHSMLEQLVAEAITSAGGGITVPKPTSGTGSPDLLLWMPDKDRELLNPAVVEVKASGFRNIEAGQVQLMRFLQATRLQCGILVVDNPDEPAKSSNYVPIPNVYVISLDEFREKLRTSTLADWLKQERNRLAHGVR